MLCTLVGVKRGIFQNAEGQDVKYGHLFIVSDFDNSDSDCIGQEASKVKFDYEGASDLIQSGLTFPCDVDVQFNSKGKCIQVILVSKDKSKA